MSDKLCISSVQCKAARAMLGWSQEQLSKRAKVARATIADFEREARTPILNNLIAIQKVLEEEGEIEFIPKNGGGEGVRFRSS